MTVTPRAMYLGPINRRSFAWVHTAEGESRGIGVVLCPPLGYEAILAHRPLRHLAERLATAGYPTVRLDYHGTGDSDGIDEQANRVEAWTASIESAAEQLVANGCSRIALYGLRAGALLAVVARRAHSPIAKDLLILHAPPNSGKAYIRELNAFHRLAAASGLDDGTTQKQDDRAIEAAGFVLWADTVEELGAIEYAALEGTPARAALLLSREDSRGEDRIGDALIELGVAVTRRTPGDYATMMQDPHKSIVPDAAWQDIVTWLNNQTTKLAPPTHAEAPADTPVFAVHITSDRVSVSEVPTVRETAIRFGPEARLFGILSEPVLGAPSLVPVVLLNSGSVHRIGPNRLHVLWARAWASRGHLVLRMDIAGIGDSAVAVGRVENETYSQTAVEDVLAALAELARRGAARPVLMGLCSGAYVAFHTARIAELRGAVLMNPQTFDYRPGDPLDVSAAQRASQATYYRRAALSGDKWKKLLKREVDVSRVSQIVWERGREVVGMRLKNWVQRLRGGADSADGPLGDEVRRVAARTRLAFIYSEGDPGLDYLDRNAEQTMMRLREGHRIDFELIAGADHTFTPPSSQRRLFAVISSWLERIH